MIIELIKNQSFWNIALQCLEYLIIWIFATIIHEIGHYIGYRLFGIKPKLKISFLKISLESEDIFKLKTYQVFLIVILGIYAGFIFLWLIKATDFIFLIYLCSLFWDINLIILLFTLKKYKEKRYGKALLYYLKDKKREIMLKKPKFRRKKLGGEKQKCQK